MHLKITKAKDIKRLLPILKPDDIQEMTVNLPSLMPLLEDMLVNLDPNWPLATPPDLIIDPENLEQCKARAKNIVDCVIEQDLNGKSVLDFGCRDGLVAMEMQSRGAKVVGFDPIPHKFWQTDNLKSTLPEQQFDLVLLYDVLDHVDKPIEALKQSVQRSNNIIVRFHPWISRHGGHLYTQLNRAFAHLIFDEQLLRKHGYEVPKTQKVIHPIHTYHQWIERAGLKIVKEEVLQNPIEDYFLNNDILKTLIQRHFKNSPFEEYRAGMGDLGRILGIHFVDMVLKK